MSFSIASSQIFVKLIQKSNGKTITINITENQNHKVKYLKNHVKQLFCPKKKFRLYYKNRHIKSRHKLIYYDITSQIQNIEIMIV